MEVWNSEKRHVNKEKNEFTATHREKYADKEA